MLFYRTKYFVTHIFRRFFNKMDDSDSSDESIIGYDRTDENVSLIHSRHERTSTKKLGVRHVLTGLGFLGFANIYAMRVNLSVAIVAMVNNSAIPHHNQSSSDVCPMPQQNSTTVTSDGEFAWDEYTQGLVLGSFFWGYMITNIFGGRLAENIGGKKVFLFGTFATAVLTLLTPIVARHSVEAFIALRVIMGLTEGVTFPAMSTMLGKWIPPLERSKIVSIVYAGSLFGIFVSMPICGMICYSPSLGWPYVFYVFGALGLLWCVAWMFLAYDSPGDHPYISEEEKRHIYDSLNVKKSQSALPIPYKEILTSMPVWGGLVGHVTQNWGFYFLLTEMPTYMKNVLHFNIQSNSFLTALPFFLMWVMSLVFGFLADHLRSRNIITTTTARRFFNTLGCYTPMVCLIAVGYAGCNSVLIVTLLCIGVGINGAIYSGYQACHLDLASNYSGTLMSFTNFVATIPGFVAPYVVGLIINGHETLTNWRIVFWIAATVYFFGSTFYAIFISGEEQSWNRKYVKDQ